MMQMACILPGAPKRLGTGLDLEVEVAEGIDEEGGGLDGGTVVIGGEADHGEGGGDFLM
jgi:hypothetical protein